MPDLIKKLKGNSIDVFLVSGGFRQMIKVSTSSDSTLHLCLSSSHGLSWHD
jgi:hypothetical protein